LKFAVVDLLPFMLKLQEDDWPMHAPDQPVKTESELGAAVNVTTVSEANVVPAGFVVTFPFPVPVWLTAKVY
jgi:hypothetical protein